MSKTFGRILVPVDFSENAEFAMSSALDAFGAQADEIIILTVYEGLQSRYTSMRISDDMDSMMDDSAHKSIQAFKEKYDDRHDNLTVMVKKGNPSAKILDTAKELNIDLIVMGSQGQNPLSRVFFGGTTYQVSRKAHCSIFVVRHNK